MEYYLSPFCLKRFFSLFLILSFLFLSGCARYKPQPFKDPSALKSFETSTQDNIQVSVAALSADMAKKTFGVPMEHRGILPIWVEIKNGGTEHLYYFLQRSIDEEYFPAEEAAYLSRVRIGSRYLSKLLPSFLDWMTIIFKPFDFLFVNPANNDMEEHFEKNNFNDGWIQPGQTKSGFVFVPYKPGLRIILVDLFGRTNTHEKLHMQRFEFLVNVGGIRPDYEGIDFNTLYPRDKLIEIQNEADLLKKLGGLPCCTTNKKGEGSGDPLNLIVIGTLDELLDSFTVANWDETEEIYWDSILKTISSFSFKKKYDFSPVSSLYFEGRHQDIAFQKARDTITERMHLRLWYTPMIYQGKPVWVGAVSRDIGVKFTTTAWNLMTHRIDSNVDEARTYVLGDLIYARQVKEFGAVGGIPPSTPEDPRKNLSKAIYYTDGKRLILDLSEKPMKTLPEMFPDSN